MKKKIKNKDPETGFRKWLHKKLKTDPKFKKEYKKALEALRGELEETIKKEKKEKNEK